MGFLARLKLEVKYIRRNEWSYHDVGAHWDSVIDYDEINKKSYSYFQRFVKAFEICTLPDKSYILDICSRTGNGTQYFFKKNKIRSAVCADVTRNMQEICRDRLTQAGVDFTTVLFDSLPLPFENDTFEGILCFETIEHMPEPASFLYELARVLKKEGELILTTPNRLWEPIHWIAAVLGLHHSEGFCSFLARRFILREAMQSGLVVVREESSVLLPFNHRWSIRLNTLLEKILPRLLLRCLALRRIFIFKKR